MEIGDLISLQNQLNICLVAGSLKPASFIEYSSHKDKTKENSITKTNPDNIKKLEEYIRSRGLLFLRKEPILNFEYKTREGFEQTIYLISKNKRNLEKLKDAKGDEEIGRALGYPKDCVQSFNQIIDGEERNGIYCQVQMSKAKQAGKTIPLWLAYIEYVPAELDIVKQKISRSAEEQGKRFVEYIRKTEPSLAEKIEIDFLNRRLPNSWTITPAQYNF